jgi:hypothetical protein
LRFAPARKVLERLACFEEGADGGTRAEPSSTSVRLELHSENPWNRVASIAFEPARYIQIRETPDDL